MNPLALVLAATFGHAVLGALTLAVVCRYERRGYEAHADRRRAFLAGMEAER